MSLYLPKELINEIFKRSSIITMRNFYILSKELPFNKNYIMTPINLNSREKKYAKLIYNENLEGIVYICHNNKVKTLRKIVKYYNYLVKKYNLNTDLPTNFYLVSYNGVDTCTCLNNERNIKITLNDKLYTSRDLSEVNYYKITDHNKNNYYEKYAWKISLVATKAFMNITKRNDIKYDTEINFTIKRVKPYKKFNYVGKKVKLNQPQEVVTPNGKKIIYKYSNSIKRVN